MKAVAGMLVASALVVAAAVALLGRDLLSELVVGTAGPLLATCGSWLHISSVFARRRDAVTGALVAGFAVKAVFFGAYVVLALKGLQLRPVPFIAAFGSAFIVLYGVEAWLLQRQAAQG